MKKISAIILSLALVLTTPVAHAGMFKKLAVAGAAAVVVGKAIAKKRAEKKQDDVQKNERQQGGR